MKKVLSVCLIILITSINTGAQVVVYLQGKYLDELVNLDSIVVENITQFDRMVLPAPAQIRTYAIDLIKGAIINGVDEAGKRLDPVRILFNRTGQAGILINLHHRETVAVDLVDLSGRVIRHQNLETGIGLTRLDLSPGANGLFIWRIQSPSLSCRVKVIGSREMDASCRVSGAGSASKSQPMFTFQPGDSVQFTIFKSGMYQNSTSFPPVHNDTAVVYLSKPCPETPFVTDYDGNVYPTVLINGRCWTRENMRTKHYADGTAIPDGTNKGNISSEIKPSYWFDYDDNPATSASYGRLYTGWAAMNGVFDQRTQGLCPNGWHISSNIEWCHMEQYLDSTVNPNCLVWELPFEGWIGTNLFPKLAEYGTEHWYFWGLTPYSTNESGFSGIGSGKRIDDGTYMGLPGNGLYWMARESGQNADPWNLPYTRLCSGGYRSVGRGVVSATNGHAVRCIKDY